MNIEIAEFQEENRSACEAILHALPQWFGIEESNRAYIAALGRLPTAVARVNDEIVGFAALEQHTPRSTELHVIAVRQELHNQGVGSALLEWAERWCDEHGSVYFHVKTRGPSTPDPFYGKTRQFYLARGFDELFESLTHWGPGDAALIMVKKLGA